MKKNADITQLAQEIMIDITNNRVPLHSAMLRASRLSLLIDMSANVKWFKDNAKYAEQNAFVVDTFQTSMMATQDRDVAVSSANPYQHVMSPVGNFYERKALRDEAKTVAATLANYRSETFNFALDIYTKWQFGNIAESVFEAKRKRTEPVLRDVFPDSQQRLNSIEQNVWSNNPEDWKNAVVSCRTLLMDLADVLNPHQAPKDKDKYINRLKDCISTRDSGKAKKNLLDRLHDELKVRIELTSDTTQGGAHQVRPSQEQAMDVVLYTYLIVSELLEIHSKRKQHQSEQANSDKEAKAQE